MPEQEDFTLPLLSEFNTKLGEMEEKQRLLKERMLLVGQNLIEIREEQGKELVQLKAEVHEMKESMEKIKSAILVLSVEVEKRARRTEVELLEKQAKMFQPLQFARIEDIKKLTKR